MTGIYIHIPFCLKKCDYCGFLSFPGKEEMMDGYVDMLLKELDEYQVKADTVFFGGGTPSLLEPRQVKRILDKINPTGEVTLEANPKTFDKPKLLAFKDAGINRLSIGCQSMEDDLLKTLGRVHTREDFLKAYTIAREVFENINVDLMFALPGQDIQRWEKTLKEVISLSPEHISAYSLQIEEGTRFYQEYKMDRLNVPSDLEERRMHHRAIEILEDAGYSHYEISNFARKGKECQHNLKYWNMEEYIGIGLGASSYFKSERFKNTDDLDKYLSGNLDREVHINSVKDTAGEMVFTALRKREGFTKERFKEVVGQSYDDFFRYILDERKEYIEEGLLVETEERVYLTLDGMDHSNEIMAKFV
ncbi:MAG: radical SAM family heme chaperone HemW [Clostridia bacterium]|nr:radical SAM family heme chaperone HemW [Clostridia bacterium]